MEGIRISSQDVLQAAAQFDSRNQQLRACLDQAAQRMKQLNASWDSPAGQAIQQRFMELLPVFERYEQTMEQYIRFLREIAQTYQETETMLKQHAEAFAA